MEEITSVVDLDDQVIGGKPRSQITNEDIYRIGTLMVVSPEKKLLLGKRAASKKNSPNRWAPTVNGTVHVGQTYIENILTETKEEIDLEISESDIILGIKRYSDAGRRFFNQWAYFVISEKGASGLVPDPEEISELRWWSISDIIDAQAENPEDFVSSFSPDFFPKIINDIETRL